MNKRSKIAEYADPTQNTLMGASIVYKDVSEDVLRLKKAKLAPQTRETEQSSNPPKNFDSRALWSVMMMGYAAMQQHKDDLVIEPSILKKLSTSPEIALRELLFSLNSQEKAEARVVLECLLANL